MYARKPNPAVPDIAGPLAAMAHRGKPGSAPPWAFQPFSVSYEGTWYDGARSRLGGLFVATPRPGYDTSDVPAERIIEQFLAYRPPMFFLGRAEEILVALGHVKKHPRQRLRLRAEVGGLPDVLVDPSVLTRAIALGAPRDKLLVGWGPEVDSPVKIVSEASPAWAAVVMPLRAAQVGEVAEAGHLDPVDVFPILLCVKRHGA